MLVFDTSAFLNGWRDHLPPSTFPGVWDLIDEAMGDGRIVTPREVLTELRKKDDDVGGWANDRAGRFVEPVEAIQIRAGQIYAEFPSAPGRDEADPFVIAEAEARGFKVVTYEGRSFSGVPTKRWARSMPGVCLRFGVESRTLPEALSELGGQF